MLAFLISAHTDAPQLHRLVKALPDDSEFFIHIDKKSDIGIFEDLLNKDMKERVHFIKHRVDVIWGSLNEVEYQMELIRAALNTGKRFQRLITLSGMDFPVWQREQIAQFFNGNVGREFLAGINMTKQGKASKLYREYRFFAMKHWKNGSIGSKFRVALRKFITSMGIKKPLTFKANSKTYELYKGAAWWAISPKLAHFILSEWDNNTELKEYFKTSFCPAETFIQTIVFNSPLWKSKCLEHEGEWPGLAFLTPLTYIYYHPVIKILTEDDYEEIMQSKKMFARKFVTGKSDSLIEKLSPR